MYGVFPSLVARIGVDGTLSQGTAEGDGPKCSILRGRAAVGIVKRILRKLLLSGREGEEKEGGDAEGSGECIGHCG
jgi:hypothetical protein